MSVTELVAASRHDVLMTALLLAFVMATSGPQDLSSLVAALRMAGLDAYPVLLSTRTNGKSQSVYPVVHQFNHIIVLTRIGEKSYLLDAIDKELVPNMIHPESVNGEGLLLNEKRDDPTWVTVIPKRSSETVEIELDIDEDEAVAELKGTFKAYRAARKRKAFKG